MGGSGGGGSISHIRPTEVEQENQSLEREFQETLAGIISDTLGIINNRDNELCQSRIGKLKDKITDLFDDAISLTYAGSVKKATYIEGASDVDIILQIKELPDGVSSPDQVLKMVEEQIKNALPDGAKTSTGNIAVTITYDDGMEIQIVPGVQTSADAALKIPSSRSSDTWSQINPKKFTDALTRRNSQCGNSLIPTIKLAKLIIGNTSLGDKISGYHIEALAVDIFRGYKESTKTTDMLRHFFDKAPSKVLKPIKDKTGQSINVDSNLGGSNSEGRKDISHLLDGISRRMKSASLQQSDTKWRDFLKTTDE